MALMLGLAVLVGAIVLLSAGPGAARARSRAQYLDACHPLFSDLKRGVAETGFARVSGTYRGQIYDIQVVPDSLNLRKLPCLWLLVTLVGKLPVAGTFDVMLRATGSESFSNFGSLPDQIAVPHGFPDDCTIRTDTAGDLPSAAVIARYMGGLDKARLKEVVIAPAGLRVVWLVQQADRGRYLLFRDAEMGGEALLPTMLKPLMDGLWVLRADVLVEAEPRERVTG